MVWYVLARPVHFSLLCNAGGGLGRVVFVHRFNLSKLIRIWLGVMSRTWMVSIN